VTKTALDKAREAPGSTKARILKAAEEVFAARGFDGASTREIAARAGVNISSLHYHWASKETLYLAVFHDVFDRILDLLRRTLSELEAAGSADRKGAIDHVMTLLFDFFVAHPNVPKLLMRRIVESTEVDVGVEREVLVPAWSVFDEWLDRVGQRRSDTESRLFMLSVHSVLLVYLLDSQPYQNLLGGSVRAEPLREQVRAHVTRLVHALLAA
jgi:AcrR family transcriptional regulator